LNVGLQAGDDGSETREGMAVARAKGKLRGKQSKLSDKQQNDLRRMHDTGDYSINDLAEVFFGLPTYRLPNPEPCQIAIKKPCHLSTKVTKNRSIFRAKLRCRTDTLFCSLARANGDGGFGAIRAVGASFERVR
jgi:hypothetical protein